MNPATVQFFSTWGPVIGVIISAGFLGGVWYSIGIIKGQTESWNNRLESHSGDIEKNTLARVRLEMLPETVAEIKTLVKDNAKKSEKAHLELKSRIVELAEKWDATCRNCG